MIWLGVALATVVLMAWAAVFALGLTASIALYVTLGALAVGVAGAGGRWWLGRKRGVALERDLMRQAERQAAGVHPERRPELLALRKQMESAIADLKGSRLGGGGSAALYALPWYAVVGPPAAGKTTALAHSGLSFRTPGGGRRKVRGLAGTRNCDWWFSDQAILLDTAGRLSTAGDDEVEWREFLSTLRKHRPRRPLDGVVVAVSTSDLSSGDRGALASLAQTLRARLDELTTGLEMRLPVYVLITKADLIAGFSEFFGDLNGAAEAQVWGSSFEVDDAAVGEPSRAARRELSLLAETLRRRAFLRLEREANPDARARIAAFPVEFAKLGRPLSELLDGLFRQSQFEETPLMRGFYFSSGVQAVGTGALALGDGASLSRLEIPGVSIQAIAPRSRSYFLSDLFQRVIFPDRGLAGRSRARGRRERRRQLALGGALLAASTLLFAQAALGYVESLELLERVERLSARGEAPPGSAARAARPDRERPPGVPLDALLAELQRLHREGQRASLRYALGPYLASDLEHWLRERYLERLEHLARGALETELRQEVASVSDLPELDPRGFMEGHDALKLYLGLCEPERLNPSWGRAALARVWARAARRGAIVGAERAADHAAEYLSALAERPSWAWPEDGVLVAKARSRLRGEQAEDLAYARILDVASAAPDVESRHVFFGAAAEFLVAKRDVRVRGAFTRLGWQRVRPVLSDEDERFAFEPWVLGYRGEGDTPFGRDGLRRRYFQEYAREWENFLLSLDARVPETLAEAIRELSVLGKVDGPFARLFRRLADNVRLELEPAPEASDLPAKLLEAGLEKLAQTAGEKPEGAEPKPRAVSPVERRFQRLVEFGFGETPPSEDDTGLPPSQLSQYLDELRSLEVSLRQIRQSQLEAGLFKQELQRSVANVERLLGGLGQTERLAIGRLLLNPLRGSQGAVNGAEAQTLNELWRSEVYAAYSRMKPLYPLSADATREIPLMDFAEFFRPQTGTLFRFYEQYLSARYSHSGDRYSLLPTERQSGFSAELTACLEGGKRISDAIFFGSTHMPSITFGVQMHPPGGGVAETSFGVGGQVLSYQNEPVRTRAIEWPAPDGAAGAFVQVRGQQGENPFQDQLTRHGDFALFRLLRAGRVAPVAPGSVDLEARWPLHGGQSPVVMRFRPPTARHPFRRGFFQRFQCPRTILSPPRGGLSRGP